MTTEQAQRPIAYTEGDTLVFRASGLGNSVRALTLALRGYEPCAPPPALQKAFDAGNRHEDELLAIAENSLGREVAYRQEEFELPLGDDMLIRGHIDGRALGEGVLVEAKALGLTLYTKFAADELFDAMPGYAYQVWAQMTAYKENLLYVVGLKAGDELNKLATSLKYYEEPPDMGMAVRFKLSAVREHYKRGTLPDECDCSGWCPYQHLHPAPEPVEDDLAGELDELADLYMDAKRQRDAADEMMAGCRDKMAKLLEQAGVDKAVSGRYATTRYVTRRPTYDHKAMKAAGWDLSPYTKIHETAIIKITPRSQDAAD